MSLGPTLVAVQIHEYAKLRRFIDVTSIPSIVFISHPIWVSQFRPSNTEPHIVDKLFEIQSMAVPVNNKYVYVGMKKRLKRPREYFLR